MSYIPVIIDFAIILKANCLLVPADLLVKRQIQKRRNMQESTKQG